MDAFFAQIEVLDNPELKGKPVVVGGLSKRGVVAACTYEARVYGVHSAMPMTQATRILKDGVFISGRYERYAEVSEEFRKILYQFTPLVETVALDEAFLDVTGSHKLFGSSVEIGHLIVKKVESEMNMNVSVGVASSKLLAKLASRFAKPKVDRAKKKVLEGVKVFEIPKGEEVTFLQPLAPRLLWGVGPKSAEKLDSLGITKISTLQEQDLAFLIKKFGVNHGHWLYNSARGIDERQVEVLKEQKSISKERTFIDDIFSHEELIDRLKPLVTSAIRKMRQENLMAKTVVLNVRMANLERISRRKTLDNLTNDENEVLDTLREIIINIDVSSGVRLVGLSLASLVESAQNEIQESLFENIGTKIESRDQLNETLDGLKNKFGESIVMKASRLREDKRPELGGSRWG